jgi:nitrogen fixation protein FixH
MPIEAASRAPARTRRREPWPFAVAGLLLAMAAVLGAFLAVALAHPDPVLVSDAYAASERYDAALRASQRAAALGLALELTAEPAPGGVRLSARLRGANGDVLAAERVLVQRERPNQGGFDIAIEAAPQADGWTAFVPLPLAGSWIIEARAERGGETAVRRIPVEATP